MLAPWARGTSTSAIPRCHIDQEKAREKIAEPCAEQDPIEVTE
jgi:hypothetical protein